MQSQPGLGQLFDFVSFAVNSNLPRPSATEHAQHQPIVGSGTRARLQARDRNLAGLAKHRSSDALLWRIGKELNSCGNVCHI